MNLEKLDWDKIRVFHVVANQLSMNAAATELGESVSTISRKISDLENTLQVRLFLRTTKGVQLTEAGEVALRHVETMADAAKALQSEASLRAEQDTNRIRLWAGEGLGAHWIAPRVNDLLSKHPELRFHLQISDQPPSASDDTVDIAIHYSEPQGSDLIMRRLGIIHYILYAAPEYISRHGVPQSYLEIGKHKFITHSLYKEQQERWDPRAAAMQDVLDFAFITNSGNAMISVCAKGSGIAILPSYVSELDLGIVPLEGQRVAATQFWMTYTERVKSSGVGMAVVQWLRDIFDAGESPWFRETFVHPKDVTIPG